MNAAGVSPLARGRLLLLSLWLGACAVPSRSVQQSSLQANSLQQQIEAAVAGFRGDVGVYVRHLGTGETAAVRADETFPTASMIKVPILGALLAKVEAGQLDYHAELTYTKDRRYPGEDLLGAFADGQKVALAKVAMLSITTSDNTAALWCQELAGGGGGINAWLAAQGFAATRVNSRTPGREVDRDRFGWGQTTPREMAELVAAARVGSLGSPALSDELLRAMSRIYWDGEALSALPPWAHAASKQGAVNASRSEVVLVDGPSGSYVFCAITKNQQDQSWQHDNEGFALLRRLSALLWARFEPDHPYTPPPGSERFW
ncbi:MAG: hypothetical protein RL398_1527 [Planctomycetota bacterium]